MQTAVDLFEYKWKTPNESAKSFQQEPEQVAGAASVYFESEEEVIGVEQLLAEPEYDDIVNTLLDFNACTFTVPESYFTEFSESVSVLTKTDCGALQRGLNEEDKTREKFLDGLSNGYDENNCFVSCEDYLLDTELEEETPNLHDVTRDVSCIGNVNSENQLADSEGRNCDIHVLKLSDASTSCDRDPVLLDKFDDMSTDELLKVFREMFGHQTSVADKQWMKPHMIFDGLENQEPADENSSFLKCSLDTSENRGAKIPPASYKNHLLTASTAFASIFTFRRKPRVQHVKRREHIQWNSFKCSSSAAGEIQLDSPCKWDSKESAEEHVKCDGMKFGISEQYLKRKPSRGGFGRRYYHGGLVGKRNSQVGCSQIPHGLLIDDTIHSAEPQDDPFGTLSDLSSDNTSEDDWTIGSETRGTYQDRKHNKYWSIPEVVKLVEGVSKYGVGRWKDIKKMFFQSSERRSPADLKDKWRNLLTASCRRFQNRRVAVAEPPSAKSGQVHTLRWNIMWSIEVHAKKKHGVPSIPHDVLKRVRELAVIYPYSRQRRSRISPTAASIASSSKTHMNEQ